MQSVISSKIHAPPNAPFEHLLRCSSRRRPMYRPNGSAWSPPPAACALAQPAQLLGESPCDQVFPVPGGPKQQGVARRNRDPEAPSWHALNSPLRRHDLMSLISFLACSIPSIALKAHPFHGKYFAAISAWRASV